MVIDELSRRSLLILGNSFGGWLARFFLRTVKGQRLRLARSSSNYLAGSQVRGDADLVLFLRHFAGRTKIFESGGAVEFVDQLHRRWLERHPSPAAQSSETPSLAFRTSAAAVEAGAVFLSYASEDRAPAERIRQVLEAAGVVVFFDRKDLRAGDDFERKLLRSISQCSLFVPVISRQTLAPGRRFFRIEWNQALEEARKVAPNETFIVPVVIDETPPDHPAVPAPFHRLHWQRLPDGVASREFIALVRRLFRRYHKSIAGWM